MDPLLDSDELEELREVGESMMETPVYVLRDEPDTEDDPAYANPYGDDGFVESDFEGGVGIIAGEDGLLKGWFVSKLQHEITRETGELATIEVQLIRFPVGTDIRPDDRVRAIESGNEYHVVDTNRDDTWPEWMRVLARRAE